MLTTWLHELAHAVVGLAVGEQPVLHHAWVDHGLVEPPSASPR